jgi:hypothetical protein
MGSLKGEAKLTLGAGGGRGGGGGMSVASISTMAESSPEKWSDGQSD